MPGTARAGANPKATSTACGASRVGHPAAADTVPAAATPSPTPTAPPPTLSNTASSRNCSRMPRCVAPTTFRMPVCWVRSVADTRMMFTMPIPPTRRDGRQQQGDGLGHSREGPDQVRLVAHHEVRFPILRDPAPLPHLGARHRRTIPPAAVRANTRTPGRQQLGQSYPHQRLNEAPPPARAVLRTDARPQRMSSVPPAPAATPPAQRRTAPGR